MKNKLNRLNPKHFFVIILSVLLLVVFSGIPESSAVLGPVHVEMNITGERLGRARANSVTAFNIYMLLNKNIEVFDWIKVWFPVDEASCNPEDICDGPLEIRGEYPEHPRFVPNEKYFEKYPDSSEKDYIKLYKILDEYTAKAEFYDCSSCTENEGKCRTVQDSSGLGCWIMGTLMPRLPTDDKERFHRINQLEHTTSIGYSPCGDCGQGGLKLIQTCDERSFQVNSTVSVEAWRQGYNPIDFSTSKATGIITPATPGRYRLRIATKAEPTPVESDSFVLPCSQISQPLFTYERYQRNEYGTYELNFDVGEGGALDKNYSKIMIDFPDCLKVNSKYTDKKIYRFFSINGTQGSYKDSLFELDRKSNIATITCPVNIDNTEHIKITFNEKIFENKCDESFTVSVATSSEPEFIESASLKTTIIEPFPIEISNLFLSDNRATMPSSYRFDLTLDAGFKIDAGEEIQIKFPDGTIFPESPESEFVKSTPNDVESLRTEENSIFMSFEENFQTGIKHRIEFSEDFGIINTEKFDTYKLEIRFHGSEKVSYSGPLIIQTPPLESTLTFLDPDKPDGCDGWYKTPPILSITCRNPDAKIRLWYDSDPIDKAIVYSGPKRLAPGSQRPVIHFQAIYGDEIEEPKSVQIFLDTVSPAIEIHHPDDEIIYTNQDVFIVSGERFFIEMLTDGGPSHQVADGVHIKVNDGEYTQILEPEIFHVQDRKGVQSEWSHEVELSEGENIVTILGRDQACNEEIWTRKIVKDTTPPKIEIIKPSENVEFEAYDLVKVKIKTEANSRVFIDKNIADMVFETADGFAYYETEIELDDTNKDILIEAIDKAGNKSSKTITLKVPHEVFTELMLWIDSPKFVVDGVRVDDLDPIPTSKSPPLPKELEGNTYMPVRAILEALGADVKWISKERRVDIELGGIELQLWIDNPVAKINGSDVKILGVDGKKVLYPTIVNDRTMLPLRFACESVGARVGWIETEKAIQVLYFKEMEEGK